MSGRDNPKETTSDSKSEDRSVSQDLQETSGETEETKSKTQAQAKRVCREEEPNPDSKRGKGIEHQTYTNKPLQYETSRGTPLLVYKKRDIWFARTPRGEHVLDKNNLLDVSGDKIQVYIVENNVYFKEPLKPQEAVSLSIRPTELGFKGDIYIEGKDLGHFSVYMIDESRAYMHDIQIGYSYNAPRNKGYGFEVYKRIIKELDQKGIKLASTNFSHSQTSISPQALSVWKKLEAGGYVKKVGETAGKIHDRFTGESRECTIPLFESV